MHRAHRPIPLLGLTLLLMAGGASCDRCGEEPSAPERSQGGSRPEHPREASSDTEDEGAAMTDERRVGTAERLMADFAERTGVWSGKEQRRYLWTDAFAVCNFLALAEVTGDESHRETAGRLVERVHHTLGRHRPDDARSGWLSGPLGAASDEHPTRAGLRIGKSLPERGPGEPMDRRLEWDRDGQYFHYLTKWMHALDQMARATERPQHELWARELAEAAHEGFTHSAGGGPPRMYWKMSVDLSRPLVDSMGHHDPLDGYVTTLELRQTASVLDGEGGPRLREALEDYRAMIEAGGRWATADPLGIGGLLFDAYRVEQLMRRDGFEGGALLGELLEAAATGLASWASSGELGAPAARRLGFRELGLAIGLRAVERMSAAVERGDFAGDDEARAELEELGRHTPLRDRIETFWLDEGHRRSPTWTEHRDINEVMLATSLVPQGFLVLPAPR